MVTEEYVDGEWRAALADAGYQASEARLFAWPGPGPKHGERAVWFPPGSKLVVDERFPDGTRLTEANAPDCRPLHRISVWLEVEEPALIAGLLRHELEHARQWDAHGRALFALHDLVLAALTRKVGDLDGCAGGAVNCIPAETDCNAAAAVFMRARHPAAAQRLSGTDHRQLVCSRTGPEPIDSLPWRMVAFAYLHHERCMELAVERERPFAELLDEAVAGAALAWRTLEGLGTNGH